MTKNIFKVVAALCLICTFVAYPLGGLIASLGFVAATIIALCVVFFPTAIVEPVIELTEVQESRYALKEGDAFPQDADDTNAIKATPNIDYEFM